LALRRIETDSKETARYGYTDYTPAGDPSQPSRIFQTMVKLDTSNNPTSEEFHYAYDGSGRLLQAAFAQTPASGFTPSTGNPYYDSSHLASSRARAFYSYDAGGRILQLNYWWDTWTGSGYGTPDALVSNTCSYEESTSGGNLNRGLKTVSDFYLQNSSDHTAFSLDHEEQYTYDSNTDYLTGASYDGGSTWTNWSYDAAGNRNDASVVDNLNRATTIGGVSRTYDILGNTTAIGSTKSMSWDVVNRMSSFTSGSTTTDYAYRADGMRVAKASGSQTVTYGYDGQMGVEECLTDSSVSSNDYTTRYALGARGSDRIETTNSSGTGVAFPIYDAHGNMVATVGRVGTGSYSVGNLRSYDAWGGIRSGSTTGAPSGRYCAQLGHVQDDESELVYMRARYYDPGAARFTSEDSGYDGGNWFIYARDNPTCLADRSGQGAVDIIGLIFDALDAILTGNDHVNAVGGLAALLTLSQALKEAKDASDVEEAWGEFMEQATYEPPEKLGAVSTIMEIIDALHTYAEEAMALAEMEAPYLALFDELKDSLTFCYKLTIITIGYSERLDWYLNDIDNG